ncbi:MAG: fasciclin domain-containing protein [Candidatus Zixiibacteriota bacterium]
MFNLKKHSMIVMALAMFAMLIAGCSEDDNNPVNNNSGPTMDIVETAKANGNFTTLLAAVEAADLVDALKGEGPLTVFAPTDEAFAALPEGTVEALLNDIDALTAILTYHVTVGAITSGDVVKETSIPTLNGSELTVTVTDNGVMIDDANIIVKDIQTTNGIIHVIDAVVIPGADQTSKVSAMKAAGNYYGGGLIGYMIQNGRLQWLTKRIDLYTVARLSGLETLGVAIKAAGLKETVKKDGPFTVFGPTNAAFDMLPEGTLEALVADPETLSNIILYHVVAGKVTSDVVVNLTEATMANGGTVDITVDGGVMVNDANVVVVDIMARNGVIHIIDGVLLP